MGGYTVNADSFQLYLTRLKEIRETLTDPKRIKFIHDIEEALKYKDSVIDNLHIERSKLMESNMTLRTERDRYKAQCKVAFGVVGRMYA